MMSLFTVDKNSTFFLPSMAPVFRLICLHSWSPASGTVWKELRGVTLLVEVDFWEQSKDWSSSQCVYFLLPVLDQDVSAQLLLQRHACLPAAMFLAMIVMDSCFSTTERPK